MIARERWIAGALIAGCWTLLGLVYSSHLYFFHTLRDNPTTWTYQLAEALADFYVWAALTPLILALSRRFPLAPGRFARGLAVHLPASLAVTLVQVALHTLADRVLVHGDYALASLAPGFTALFARTYHFGLLVYWAIVAVHHAVAYYQNQRLLAAELEAQLATAQLEALKMQLHPHFLFNTLHAVSALMHRDVAAADRMIARLSELLRISLASEGVQEVRLERELDFLERYLEIERMRFADRLTVEMRVDPDALDARVPNLILQPLVENSIRHGIAKRRGPGLVEISASREDGALLLAVRDNGAGMAAGADGEGGVGLANTRARLEKLYGARHRFEMRPAEGGGLEVLISIPYRGEAGRGGGGDGPDPRPRR